MPPTPRVTVDDVGVRFDHLPDDETIDVAFDGKRIWSATPRPTPRGDVLAAWPAALQRRLDGRALVTVSVGEVDVYAEEVSFGTGEGRISTVDGHGIEIHIDKWGLIQRPFDGRRAAGVVDALLDQTELILEVMRRDCGIEGWISFGSLLGAARDGKVIGYDSDVDLCYVSEQASPAEMTLELWRIARALRAAGMRVEHKSGSFITVLFRAPDGAPASVDVYTTFFLGDHFLATATVRSTVPRSAVLPLGTVEFEGRMLPAPAKPDVLLEVSYGPSWGTPDPGFRHLPGPDITDRFDGWFGSLMAGKRDWRRHNRDKATPDRTFARWVAERLEPGSTVVDLGTGRAVDARVLARAGHRVVGLDFALPPRSDRPKRPAYIKTNLLDLRQVLAVGAQLAREPGPHVLVGHDVLEALDRTALENVEALLGMLLRAPGDRLFLTGLAMSPREAQRRTRDEGTGRLRPFDPAPLVDVVTARGGVVEVRDGVDAAASAVAGGASVRWIMTACWS